MFGSDRSLRLDDVLNGRITRWRHLGEQKFMKHLKQIFVLRDTPFARRAEGKTLGREMDDKMKDTYSARKVDEAST